MTALQLGARQVKVSGGTGVNLPSPGFSPEAGRLAKIASFNNGICDDDLSSSCIQRLRHQCPAPHPHPRTRRLGRDHPALRVLCFLTATCKGGAFCPVKTTYAA